MRYFTLFLIIIASTTMMQAQPGERIQALKVSYFTKALDLTPGEAERFWPVYNEFQDKMDSLKKQQRATTFQQWQNRENLSDEEIEETLVQHFEYKQQELDLERAYLEKFKKVLPIRKVAQLKIAEKRFKLYLLEELRKRRNAPPGRMQR